MDDPRDKPRRAPYCPSLVRAFLLGLLGLLLQGGLMLAHVIKRAL